MILWLSIVSLICFSIALLLNLLLLFLLFYRPSNQLKGYRWISIAFIITDLLFAFAYSVIVPMWHADGNGLVVLIPVGFTSSLPSSHFLNSLLRPAFILWHIGMMSTSFLVAATFTYRYTFICSSKWLGSVCSLRFSHFAIIGVCLIAAIGHSLVLDAFTSPINSLTITLNERISSIYGVDFTQVYYQGVNRADPNQGLRFLIGMAESGMFNITFLSMMAIIVFTGSRMYSAIKRSNYSKRARERQMHMFNMLIAQGFSPLCFLYIPPIIDVLSFALNYVLPYSVCILKALLVFMFPIANPLVILIFTEDYRMFLMGRKYKRNSSYSLSNVSNGKPKISMVHVKVTPI